MLTFAIKQMRLLQLRVSSQHDRCSLIIKADTELPLPAYHVLPSVRYTFDIIGLSILDDLLPRQRVLGEIRRFRTFR